MKAARLIATVLIGMSASGCIAIPVGERVVSGHAISVQEISFIKPGMTTKTQVLARLDDPSTAWEDERVLVYDWEEATVWFRVMASRTSGAAGLVDFPIQQWLLLIEFDETDRVTRLERTVRPFNESYGEFLKRWVYSYRESRLRERVRAAYNHFQNGQFEDFVKMHSEKQRSRLNCVEEKQAALDEWQTFVSDEQPKAELISLDIVEHKAAAEMRVSIMRNDGSRSASIVYDTWVFENGDWFLDEANRVSP